MGVETLALITGVVVLTTAIVAFFEKLRRDVKEIHILVNKRMDEALARIRQLIEALEEAGIKVPTRPGDDNGG